jgi:hypothetical protein
LIRWDAVALFASAALVGLLGALHVAYTFFGSRLHPRDPALREAMAAVSPRISGDTTMWRAWVGFNASHGMGALLFGLVYGWLAMRPGPLLLGSAFLAGAGVAYLLGLAVLAQRYWFRVPFGGVLLSLALFAGALLHDGL